MRPVGFYRQAHSSESQPNADPQRVPSNTYIPDFIGFVIQDGKFKFLSQAKSVIQKHIKCKYFLLYLLPATFFVIMQPKIKKNIKRQKKKVFLYHNTSSMPLRALAHFLLEVNSWNFVEKLPEQYTFQDYDSVTSNLIFYYYYKYFSTFYILHF